ncbi:MAG: DEAD/DEAH box helicase [Candidatus Eisenbacteria bacterium]|uniref:DEAD/DEAH box helicase n=1 Tax=Eiseniibacteriota bacterium TaxID=2212470 RepID=A0A938BRH0_UNCEI|nr:DEAD/DEAH box helicase [Candidatus Eisenbacteria bacterium]
MANGHCYRVGEKVHHQAFGEGLVVDVRNRDFFDILEIAFSDAVRKVTSIHPQLSAVAVAGGRAGSRPRPPGAPAASGPAANRAARGSRAGRAAGGGICPIDPLAYAFPRSPILHLDVESARPFAAPRGPAVESPAAFLAHIQALELARRRGFEQLLALNHARDVQKLEHQIRACLRALREMKGRALLADEVGLGKTIEAGLILKEYVLRGLARKALILVPASLVTQWREELTHKFDIPAATYSRGMDWQARPFLIASLDTAKSAGNRRAIAAAGFDLLIVDEAHRLRNHLTQAWRFIDSLSLKYLLLLTATPVQNDMRELYNLVTLLRPGALGTYRSFRREFVVRGDKRLPKNTHTLSRLLSDVMIRTTRSSTSIQFPRREVRTLHIDLTPEERAFYDAVSAFVQRRSEAPNANRGGMVWPLLMIVLQKEIGSSTAAALGTLAKAARGRLAPARGELRELLALGEGVRTQAKLEALENWLGSPPRRREKVIVFSQFRRTVTAITERLRERGWRVGAFHGSLTGAAKDAVVAAFRDHLDVLVSTEAGGEGRNLQFCRRLVNYDLPWNPMRVEQRIGRIHRIGQTRDVEIVNLSARGTLEAYVLRVLQDKIGMFRMVIGEMDQVLGNLDWEESFEARVFRLWTTHRERPDLEQAFEELGERLDLARRRYEHVKAYDREIFESTAVR